MSTNSNQSSRAHSVAADDPHPFLTPRQVAHRWLVCKRTVERMIRDRALPHVRIGRQIRVRLADVIAYEKTRQR